MTTSITASDVRTDAATQIMVEDSTDVIFAEAKSLASAVGVSVTSNADVCEILDEIGAELEAMLQEAETNPGILSTVSSFISRLRKTDRTVLRTTIPARIPSSIKLGSIIVLSTSDAMRISSPNKRYVPRSALKTRIL